MRAMQLVKCDEKELRIRIKKAEKEIRQGKGLNKAQMLAKHKAWKRKHGL